MDEFPVESAGFGIRAAGRVIDYLVPLLAGIVSAGFLAVVAGAIAGATHKSETDVFELMTKGGGLTYLGSVVATLIYHAFTESVGGASLGKRLFGLEVVSETLGPATLRQTFVRNLVFVFVLLGAIALSAEALLAAHLCSYWLFA